jgi:hypothetical protein
MGEARKARRKKARKIKQLSKLIKQGAFTMNGNGPTRPNAAEIKAAAAANRIERVTNDDGQMEEVLFFTEAERALLMRDYQPLAEIERQLAMMKQRYLETVAILRHQKSADEEGGWEVKQNGFARPFDEGGPGLGRQGHDDDGPEAGSFLPEDSRRQSVSRNDVFSRNERLPSF